MSNFNCCKRCTTRCKACHDSCLKYKVYKEHIKRCNARRREAVIDVGVRIYLFEKAATAYRR